jgi:hypothetical protein
MSINFQTTSAVVLQNEIKKLGPDIIGLELGVWTGHNMCHLLEECDNIKHLYGVDPYLPYQDWNRYIDQNAMNNARNTALNNLKHFNTNRWTLIQDTSENVSKIINELDFIFIDGDHSYERCLEDLNLWYGKIKKGGIFSGHDYSLKGVNKALLDFKTNNRIFNNFYVIPNDVWYWIKD